MFFASDLWNHSNGKKERKQEVQRGRESIESLNTPFSDCERFNRSVGITLLGSVFCSAWRSRSQMWVLRAQLSMYIMYYAILRYTSFRNVFPLWALGHFAKEYGPRHGCKLVFWCQARTTFEIANLEQHILKCWIFLINWPDRLEKEWHAHPIFEIKEHSQVLDIPYQLAGSAWKGMPRTSNLWNQGKDWIKTLFHTCKVKVPEPFKTRQAKPCFSCL